MTDGDREHKSLLSKGLLSLRSGVFREGPGPQTLNSIPSNDQVVSYKLTHTSCYSHEL